MAYLREALFICRELAAYSFQYGISIVISVIMVKAETFLR